VIIMLISFLLVIAFTGWLLIRVPNSDEPDRPMNVPKAAFWRGGVDEGFWFVLDGTDTVKRSYRFKIFNDYNGELAIDANFRMDTTCDSNMPSVKRIADKVKYFEFDKIVLDSCMLEIIYPAFGGSLWELEKSK
jgi:hypothetical protein